MKNTNSVDSEKIISFRNGKSYELNINSLRDHSDLLICDGVNISIEYLDKLLSCIPEKIIIKNISIKDLEICKDLLSYSFEYVDNETDALFIRKNKKKVKRNKYIPLADVDMMVLDKYEENR